MPLRRATVEAVSRTSTSDPEKFTMLVFIYVYIFSIKSGGFSYGFRVQSHPGFLHGRKTENELRNHAHAQSSFTEPERK